MKRIKLMVYAVVTMMMLTACTGTKSQTEKLDVKVQVWAMKYLVEEIGKENVNVTLAVTSGDAHHKEPTQKEIAELSKSSLFFYVGAGDLGVEAEEIMKATEGNKEKNVNLFSHVEALNKGTEKDPHAWLSPKQMKIMSATVKDKLIEKKADKKNDFETNYNNLQKKLTDLDQEITQMFTKKTKSEILTEHAAYGYLARDYNFAQHGLTEEHHHDGESTSSSNGEHAELSASQVETLKEVVTEEGFKTLFADSQNQSETIENLAKELNVKLVKVSTLETVSKEEEQKDYIQHIKEIAEKFSSELK